MNNRLKPPTQEIWAGRRWGRCPDSSELVLRPRRKIKKSERQKRSRTFYFRKFQNNRENIREKKSKFPLKKTSHFATTKLWKPQYYMTVPLTFIGEKRFGIKPIRKNHVNRQKIND